VTLPDRYPVPARIHRVEEVIQRSRFITTLARAATPGEAHAFVDRIREEFPDATHNCWAFVAGPPASSGQVGMSDDGEPHGTAGRPMLTALLHGGVGEIVAVTTRYYGGVKLGKGGLGRAYAGGVVGALETLPRVQKVDRVQVALALEHGEVPGARRLFERFGVRVEGETWGQGVTYLLSVPSDVLEGLEGEVGELTRGRTRLEAVDASGE
jgi:uncharacterized YigZ family protein